MSELFNTKNRGENFRRNLLANVSMLALVGYLGASQSAALAADDDPPALWIELGGQAERAIGLHQIFDPAFVDKAAAADRKPLIDSQMPPPFSIGGEGKITFTPHDTRWVLSASIIYGRADSAKHLHQQTAPPYVKRYFGTQLFPPPYNNQFGDAQTDFKESHAVLDFQAGKDVGLGLFGAGGKSVVSAGVRFAQFTASSDVALHGRQYRLGAAYSGKRYYSYFHHSLGYRTVNTYRHDYGATLQTRRSTHAFGPSISWDASSPVEGNGSDTSLNVDWGLNAGVLFGRQRTQIHHQTSGQYTAHVGRKFNKYPRRHYNQSSYAPAPVDLVRSRTVTIPNVGGFIGASYRIANFKVSLGYRADFFFGAMDGGIDTRKSSTLGFYGPFATISVGIGG